MPRSSILCAVLSGSCYISPKKKNDQRRCDIFPDRAAPAILVLRRYWCPPAQDARISTLFPSGSFKYTDDVPSRWCFGLTKFEDHLPAQCAAGVAPAAQTPGARWQTPASPTSHPDIQLRSEIAVCTTPLPPLHPLLEAPHDAAYPVVRPCHVIVVPCNPVDKPIQLSFVPRIKCNCFDHYLTRFVAHSRCQ